MRRWYSLLDLPPCPPSPLPLFAALGLEGGTNSQLWLSTIAVLGWFQGSWLPVRTRLVSVEKLAYARLRSPASRFFFGCCYVQYCTCTCMICGRVCLTARGAVLESRNRGLLGAAAVGYPHVRRARQVSSIQLTLRRWHRTSTLSLSLSLFARGEGVAGSGRHHRYGPVGLARGVFSHIHSR